MGCPKRGLIPTTGLVIGTKMGGSTFDSTGRRHSATDLLRHTGAPNIRVAVYASVERILLASSAAYTGSRQSAIGVVYRDQMGGVPPRNSP